jgi:MFS transporter, Spinster family, sphingosine-1-phosphate transporter
MNCVPKALRGQANAIAIFIMHMLGDFPSPVIIGWLFTYSIYWGVMFTMVWLSWAVFFWLLAWNTSVIVT